MSVRVELVQTVRERMKPRGNKTKAEERHIKMFVQHHLTLDSAEHRNLDSRVREGAKIRRTSSIPRRTYSEPVGA